MINVDAVLASLARLTTLDAWSNIFLAVIVLLSAHFIASFVTRKLALLADKTSNRWDDELLRSGVIRNVCYVLALGVCLRLLSGFGDWLVTLVNIANIGLVAHALHLIVRAVEASLDCRGGARRSHARAISQVAVVAIYVMALVMVVSAVRGQSISAVFVGLWGLVLGLTFVFKDVITNFLAGIYLVTNGRLRIGDWVVLESKGVDGDVSEIGLLTVQVVQWDKTLVTVPTVTFLDGFKNWRNINAAGGRRIKDCIWLSPSSVKDTGYITNLNNKLRRLGFDQLDADSLTRVLQQRTNIGAFREYLLIKLMSDEGNLNLDLTTLVRTLEPTPQGIPVQIYAFLRATEWVAYERYRSRAIEESVLLASEVFGLKVFEYSMGFNGIGGEGVK